MWRRLLLPLLLCVAAVAVHRGRVLFIRSWFVPGVPERGARSPLPVETTPSGPLRPVRVLLLDGLSAGTAERLPALRALCDEGLRLEVEVGFPSVSLPVQHVLWTGAWQEESGVLFAVAQLPRPVFESLPELVTRRSANAVAVSEAHPEIARSFPFSQHRGARAGAVLTPLAFAQEALAAAQSNAALVLIHALRIDEAGHHHGGASTAYLEAAREADRLLAALRATRRDGETWLVLSDHGHLPEGGHGDLEPCVQRVRACLAGPGLARGASARATIPDLNAILAERLGVRRPSASVGRSLAAVLAGAPALPSRARCPAPRVALALILGVALGALGLALVAAPRAGRGARIALLLPWGATLALLLLVAWGGAPSLSRAYVYPGWSPLLVGAALPGALLVALQLATALRLGITPARALLALAAGALAPALVAWLATGAPLRLPPLCPFASGWASALTGLAAPLLLALGLAGVLLSACGRRGDRS